MVTDRTSARAILRADLLARLERVSPRIVALIAPAGFGKTTLVRQYAGDRERVGICDCTGIENALDFARRLIPALAEEHPDRGTTLTQRELLLGAGDASPAERLDLALSAWSAPAPASTFVFENAEHLAAAPTASELFARLLASRPTGRTIIICSREPLRMHLTRFAPPHEIVTIRAGDLTFTRDEQRELFAGLGVGERELDRIAGLSQGWPIALLLFARFAAEGRLKSLLDALGDVAFEELHDYLADHVLESFTPEQRRIVFACSVIPRATARDVIAVLGSEGGGRALAELERTSPFVTAAPDGTHTVHPLVRSMVLEREQAHHDDMLRSLAQSYDDEGEHQRAAEIHLARGDQEAAALSLNRIEVIMTGSPTMAYAQVLATLDRTLVLRFPRLWGCTALLRLWIAETATLLREADIFYSSLPPETPALERFYVFYVRPLFLSYEGRFEEALALVERFARDYEVPEVPTKPFHGWVMYLRALLLTRMGRLREGERQLALAAPHVDALDAMASGVHLALGADVFRIRGEYESERASIERSLERVRRSSQQNFIAFNLAEAAFGSWLAGDDARFERHARDLDAIVEREGVRAFGYFAAVACGRSDRDITSADQYKWIAYARVIAACGAKERPLAEAHARAAVESANRYGAPFTRLVAWLTFAEIVTAERAESYGRARAAALAIDEPALHDAVEAAMSGADERLGVLGPIVRRLRRGRSALATSLEIELVTGTVRMNGAPVSLPVREHELLLSLAHRREPIARETLFELLWPTLDEEKRRNALNVCLHRLRTHLGGDRTLIVAGEFARLRDDVRVDVREIERTLAELRARETLDARDVERLRELHVRLSGTASPRLQGWEWYDVVARRIGELRREVVGRLAKRALDAGNHREAMAYARDLLAHDACDETAHEIIIRGNLAAGDRSAALGQFRIYRDTLQAELDCEPSPALAELLGA